MVDEEQQRAADVARLRLLPEVAPYAEHVAAAAYKHRLPALYIAAVISRETHGRNILGDGGHGHGLMQIDDRWHGAWLQRNANGLEPASNIDFGASLLRANLNQAIALELEGPAALKFAASAYNCGCGPAALGLKRHGDSDAHTTGADYGRWVMARMRAFERQTTPVIG
jgi:hypothetical protein